MTNIGSLVVIGVDTRVNVAADEMHANKVASSIARRSRGRRRGRQIELPALLGHRIVGLALFFAANRPLRLVSYIDGRHRQSSHLRPAPSKIDVLEGSLARITGANLDHASRLRYS